MLSCTQSVELSWKFIPLEKVESYLERDIISSFHKFDKIILIPEYGCNECVQDAFAYFFENSKNPRIFFIFTEIADYKLFKLKFSKELMNQKNVWIDYENTFKQLDIDLSYPYEIKIQKGSFFYRPIQ